MKTRPTLTGFTLIELLVVISIIAILAGFSVPVYTKIMMNARQANAMNNVRQIGLGLRLYANDFEAYPTKKNNYDEDIKTSNDVFRGLVPNYVDNERVFSVPTSKAGGTADGDVSSVSTILARGENHWAYIDGLNVTSNSTWPLIVDHTDGNGNYLVKENTLGGTWKGTKAVVFYADSSARIVPLLGTGEKRYLPRIDDKTKNALNVSEYMGDTAKLLEPTL
jgi:prepilin-type N-terminal cleavage/methylation domain-containing protein